MKVVPITSQVFFKRSISVAEHYGFHPVEDVSTITEREATQANVPRQKNVVPLQTNPSRRFDYRALPEVLQSFVDRADIRKKQTVMFYTPSCISSSSSDKSPSAAITLSVVGVTDALPEMIVLKSAITILEELGISRYKIRINSIGDADSSARFVRDLSSRLRGKLTDLPQTHRDTFRTDPLEVLTDLYEHRHPLVRDMPAPLDFLTAPSRKHFKEILELLEYSGISFELDDRLYGNPRLYSHTLFEIIEETDSPDSEAENVQVLARGGRYDNLTRAYVRSAVPAVGIVIALQTRDNGAVPPSRRRKKPNACLVHIGREARIRTIDILDTFRREKIPIEQCIQFERFTEQLAYAEAHNIKYVIIIGQREVHAGQVIVRNAEDRTQHHVPIEGLPRYVKNLSV